MRTLADIQEIYGNTSIVSLNFAPKPEYYGDTTIVGIEQTKPSQVVPSRMETLDFVYIYI